MKSMDILKEMGELPEEEIISEMPEAFRRTKPVSPKKLNRSETSKQIRQTVKKLPYLLTAGCAAACICGIAVLFYNAKGNTPITVQSSHPALTALVPATSVTTTDTQTVSTQAAVNQTSTMYSAIQSETSAQLTETTAQTTEPVTTTNTTVQTIESAVTTDTTSILTAPNPVDHIIPTDYPTGVICIDSWEAQYVDMPLDLETISFRLDAHYPNGEIFDTLPFTIYNPNRHCFHLDTSEVDTSKPGKYTVWLETVEGAIGTFSTLEPDVYGNDTLVEKEVKMEKSRTPYTVEVEVPDTLSFTDETLTALPDSPDSGIQEITFRLSDGDTNTVYMRYVFNTQIEYTVSDPEILEVGLVNYHKQYEGIGLWLKKTGDVTLTATADGGKTVKQLLIHIVP